MAFKRYSGYSYGNSISFRDDYYLHLYAEEILRKKFLAHPPKGKSKLEIRRMDVESLIALDMDSNYSE